MWVGIDPFDELLDCIGASSTVYPSTGYKSCSSLDRTVTQFDMPVPSMSMLNVSSSGDSVARTPRRVKSFEGSAVASIAIRTAVHEGESDVVSSTTYRFAAPVSVLSAV